MSGELVLNVGDEPPTESKKRKHAPKESQVLKKPRLEEAPKSRREKPEEIESVKSDRPFVSSLFTSNPAVPECSEVDVTPRVEDVFSNTAFTELGLHAFLAAKLSEMFAKPTRIQSLALPKIGRPEQSADALIKAQTGTGKTIVYVCAILNRLQAIRPKISRTHGVMALVLLPTKELARQTYDTFLQLGTAFTWIVSGLVIGVDKRKSEKARIRKGINVLVTTPGRLLDHLDSTANLTLANLKYLVIDEADLLLEMGFQQQIGKILQHSTNQERQTLLLSATLTPAVEDLAILSLKTDRLFIDAYTSEDVKLVSPISLEHFFVFIPTKLRLVALIAFLQEKVQQKSGKVLVFFATQDLVDFHCELLQRLELGFKPMRLHGKMAQRERMRVFEGFRRSKSGLLFSTDVAARGLDLSSISWVVQCSAPSTLTSYLHRSGRSGRVGEQGSCLLFLLPSEVNFLQVLQQEDISVKKLTLEDILEKLDCPGGRALEARATWLQLQAEKLVSTEESVVILARQAFQSYVRFYATYPKCLRQAFNLKDLHLGHVAKSLALREAPSKVITAKQRREVFVAQKKDAKFKRTSRVEGGQRVISEFDSGLPSLAKSKKRK